MAVLHRFDLDPAASTPPGTLGRFHDELPLPGSHPRPSRSPRGRAPVPPRRSRRTGRTAPHDGLLAVGAVGGSAIALVITEVTGTSGVATTVAILVGLDVGVLMGAGIGTWLARRASRLTGNGD